MTHPILGALSNFELGLNPFYFATFGDSIFHLQKDVPAEPAPLAQEASHSTPIRLDIPRPDCSLMSVLWECQWNSTSLQRSSTTKLWCLDRQLVFLDDHSNYGVCALLHNNITSTTTIFPRSRITRSRHTRQNTDTFYVFKNRMSWPNTIRSVIARRGWSWWVHQATLL